ncbi:hypothetical protein E1B28_013449 [Marasmius oreades]|uniref:Cytochrome P450 n=1 Tax=Marasmius oreades TaxID=181124 RepID=A0A9P7RQ78_9AGAR|nr:uncharacterized protein E1B28_013449 [Marasmius oreades]KAG7087487.1 hypothetical protein E1B28_013449 [Marasmius oreades]
MNSFSPPIPSATFKSILTLGLNLTVPIADRPHNHCTSNQTLTPSIFPYHPPRSITVRTDTLLRPFIILVLSLFTLRLLATRLRHTLPLPPGPKGLPVIGNVREVRAKRDKPLWITYSDWARTYGDVFTFKVFGSRTVVLNSYKAITELLDKKSHNYSDRPDMPMTIDLMRWDWNIGLMRYNDWWRLHRRTFHQFFQPRALPEYYDIQTERTTLLMQKLATSPQDFFQHIRNHSGGIILEIIYGYQLQAKNDPYIKLADDAWVGLKEAGNHGSFLVDYIPILKHVPSCFPGASFKTKAEVWGSFTDQLKDCPWAFLKQSMEEGMAVPCFSTRNLEKFKISCAESGQNSVMEEVIKNCAAVSLTAGADTTVSAVLSFILAMVAYPDVQARAQREINEVVGSRPPEFSERENLPYIEAILSETLRWNPVTPLAVPHRSVNDDVYDGYLIPGGSTVVANAWAVLHDESLYGPDTMRFNPDRFLSKEPGQKLPPSPEPIAFGFGRRICPGRHLALNSIWLVMTYLLTSFTMAKELDSDGKEVEPVIEYSDGLSSHPRPFQCRFIPRSRYLHA